MERMTPTIDDESVWELIEQQAQERRRVPALQTLRAAGVGRHALPRSQVSARRPRGRLRAAIYASFALILVAAVIVGGIAALKYVERDQPILIIVDGPNLNAVLSDAELARWGTDAAAFGDRYYGAWGDADAECAVIDAEFADDAVYYDPSQNTFGIEGKQAIMSACRQFMALNPDLRAQVTGMYLSADGSVYRVAPDVGLQLYPFENGKISGVDLWWSPATLGEGGLGCFAPGHDGYEQLREIAERYLAAWSSEDKAQISALYHEDATFSDSLLGLRVQGAETIAELADERFGSDTTVSFEIIDLYAQTNGSYLPYEQQPERGAVIGVGIHYRATLEAGGVSTAFQGLTTLELGARTGVYPYFKIDPNGHVTREEVFYDTESLPATSPER
jgi:ketosteroid isomerase-like protein